MGTPATTPAGDVDGGDCRTMVTCRRQLSPEVPSRGPRSLPASPPLIPGRPPPPSEKRITRQPETSWQERRSGPACNGPGAPWVPATTM